MFGVLSLFQQLSLGSYQYHWCIYPITSQVVVMLNPETLSARVDSHYYHFKSFWYDPAVDRANDLLHPNANEVTQETIMIENERGHSKRYQVCFV